MRGPFLLQLFFVKKLAPYCICPATASPQLLLALPLLIYHTPCVSTCARSTMSYQPPSEDLVEALIHLVRYITVLEPSPGSTASKAYRAAGVPGVAGSVPVAGAPRQAAGVERAPAQSKQVRCGACRSVGVAGGNGECCRRGACAGTAHASEAGAG